MKIEKFDNYLIQTVDAIDLLYQHKLYGQMLIIMYSAIDSFGLIDSPLSNKKANGDTFKKWVAKYLLSSPKFNISSIDLWSSRCSLLHTHTSKSNLSNQKKAKEIQYFSGDRNNLYMKKILETAPLMGNRNNIVIIIEELVESFLNGLIKFESDFKLKVKSNESWMDRVKEILSKREI